MELDATGMAGAGLAVTSFVASSHPAESCGLNGLPLTPHSTAILGAGQLLLTCRHPHLARCRLTLAWCLNTCVPVQEVFSPVWFLGTLSFGCPFQYSLVDQQQVHLRYLDIQRGKHQRIVVVQERWEGSLAGEVGERGEEELLLLTRQLLQALAYLNQMNIVNTNLVREAVMLDSAGQVKLFNYGLGRLTNYGAWVAFPTVCDPRVTAPEVLRRGARAPPPPAVTPEAAGELQTHIPAEAPPPHGASCDTWSLGLLLATLVLDIPRLWPEAKVAQVRGGGQVGRHGVSGGEEGAEPGAL